jgi:hypothetical protein
MKLMGLLGVFSAIACIYAGCSNPPTPATPLGTPVAEPTTDVIPAPQSSGVVRSPASSASSSVPGLPVPPPSPQHGPRPPRPDSSSGAFCPPITPVVSQDRCSAPADCAPASLCHASSCVAKAKAPTPSPSTVCTMNYVCNSTDFGKCDCVSGYCTLVSR